MCERRCARLYRRHGLWWDCRTCARLTYRSRQDRGWWHRHGHGRGRISHLFDMDEREGGLCGRRTFRRGLSRWRKRVRNDEDSTKWPVQVTGTPTVACLFALLDRTALVRVEHLRAALMLWAYCERSVGTVFGDDLGDPTADTIRRALANAQGGLDRTAIHDLFGNHLNAGRIDIALALLARLGIASPVRRDGSGRSAEVWILGSAKDAKEGASFASFASPTGSDAAASGCEVL